MRVLWDLAHLALVGMLVMVLLRIVAHDGHMLLVWANSFTLYALLPAYVLAAVAVKQRRWKMMACCLALIGAHVVLVAPDFTSGDVAQNASNVSRSVRIFNANLFASNATPQGIIDELLASDADCVTLQELSPRWQRLLEQQGVFDRYPHKMMLPVSNNFGLALLSKTPLEDEQIVFTEGVPVMLATVRVDEAPLRICVWHPVPPAGLTIWRTWTRQYAWLFETIKDISQPLVIVGDFNATQYSQQLQRLEAAEFCSAHKLCGRGTSTTYPNGNPPFMPIRIDHLFLSPGVTCLDIREGIGLGSDHRPLIAEIALLNEL